MKIQTRKKHQRTTRAEDVILSSFFTELKWKRIPSHSVSFPFYSQQLSFIKWTQRKYKNISFESKQKNTMSSVKQFNKKRTFVFLLKSLQLVVESECLSAGLSVCPLCGYDILLWIFSIIVSSAYEIFGISAVLFVVAWSTVAALPEHRLYDSSYNKNPYLCKHRLKTSYMLY